MEAFTRALFILDDIRSKLQPTDQAKIDDLECLCRGYMELDQDNPSRKLGLTPSRSAMFALLLKRRGQTVSRDALQDVSTPKANMDASPKVVDVHMVHIRRGLIGTEYQNMIETVWGRGFRLRSESEGPLLIVPFAGKTCASKYYRVAA